MSYTTFHPTKNMRNKELQQQSSKKKALIN